MPRKKNTRAAQGSGTIRKRPDGRWEARVTVGRDPGTGKQVQRSVYGSTQQEVRKKLAEITAAVDSGTYSEPSKLTVSEWLTIWSDEYLGNAKPHTKKSYEATIRNHIVPGLGATRLSDLTPIKVQKFVNGLASTKKTAMGDKLNPKTVKNVHGVLHSALQQAVRCGLIKTNPADNTVLPKRENSEVQVLESTCLPEFFQAIENDPFRLLYLFDLFTGMRQSEILGLQWQDVDFEAATVTVRRQLQYLGSAYEGYQFATPKNGKTRIIGLPGKALEVLRGQRVQQNTMRLAAGPAWKNENDLIFTDATGQHLKHDVIYRHLKRIYADMGRPNLRFHDLRHSYAVLSLQSGVDVKSVQESMGHYSAAFTLDQYATVTDSMRKESADKLNTFLERIAAE